MASLNLALEITSSVIGVLYLSIDIPPIKSSSIKISKLKLFATALIILVASLQTSGPTPSPGNKRIFIILVINNPGSFFS